MAGAAEIGVASGLIPYGLFFFCVCFALSAENRLSKEWKITLISKVGGKLRKLEQKYARMMEWSSLIIEFLQESALNFSTAGIPGNFFSI